MTRNGNGGKSYWVAIGSFAVLSDSDAWFEYAEKLDGYWIGYGSRGGGDSARDPKDYVDQKPEDGSTHCGVAALFR